MKDLRDLENFDDTRCTTYRRRIDYRFMNNLLVQIHFNTEAIWWTGLAPWEFEFPFPGSITSAFLCPPFGGVRGFRCFELSTVT